MKPDLLFSFNYRGKQFNANWYDLHDKSELEAITWQQVYVVGDLNGKVPLVEYANPVFEPTNLPGGKTEPGETIEQTLRREVKEELNMEVSRWYPLGYQAVTSSAGVTVNQLRVYATLVSTEQFVRDPGGGVVGYRLVNPAEVNAIIGYGEAGERLMRLAAKFFNHEHH